RGEEGTRQGDQRRVGRDDDPTALQPVVQGLPAQTAVIEGRQDGDQIACSLSLQLLEELVHGRGADRKREDSLTPLQASTPSVLTRFQNDGDPLAAADTRAGQAVAGSPPPHLLGERQCAARSG